MRSRRKSSCKTCLGYRRVRDRSTGQEIPCPECVTGEWAPRKRLGWAAGYWEPGGYFRNVDGKWRLSASYVLIFNIVLLIGQVGFWWFGRFISRMSLENFIYQTIFFTFTSNFVTWFFALNTWKYAKDSSDALVQYSEDTDKAMKEFGMTIQDLNDIGRAVVESGVTAEGVKELIHEVREVMDVWKGMDLKPGEAKEIIDGVRKMKATEARLEAPKFEAAFSEGVVNG